MFRKLWFPPSVFSCQLKDQNVKYSALSTHSPHRLLQQEDERRASPGSPVWSARWTGAAPAGAPAGWPRRSWSLRRPATDWRGPGTPRLQTSDTNQTNQQVRCLKGNHQIKPCSTTLTKHFDTSLTFGSLLLRRCCFCRVPFWPVSVGHVDEPHHCSWRRSQRVKILKGSRFVLQEESKKH